MPEVESATPPSLSPFMPTTNKYITHKNADGTRAILANGHVIATCPSDIVAAKLMAVLMVSEIEAPIEWPAPSLRQPDETRPCNGGVQHFYHFANGYGASVVRHSFSYGAAEGKWELAVLKGGALCYSTEITSDVLGYLSEPEVNDVLARIEAL